MDRARRRVKPAFLTASFFDSALLRRLCWEAKGKPKGNATEAKGVLLTARDIGSLETRGPGRRRCGGGEVIREDPEETSSDGDRVAGAYFSNAFPWLCGRDADRRRPLRPPETLFLSAFPALAVADYRLQKDKEQARQC